MVSGRLSRLFVVVSLVTTSPAPAEETEAQSLAALSDSAPVSVAKALSGQSLRLEDGRELRLDGILAPDTEREGEAARVALAGLTEGRSVTIRGMDPAPDRYGRQIGQAIRDDGLWLEAALLDEGIVRVATRPGHAGLAAALLAHEAQARRARLGLWARGPFGVHRPEAASSRSGIFQIIEGRVLGIETRSGAIWLDFDQDHRLIAARIDRHGLGLFRAAGIDPSALLGTEIRLRGWTFWQGRPVIDLDHPQAIERLQPRQD